MEGIWRADHALASYPGGRLASTLTALFLSAGGAACGASVGNSALLALPPRRQTGEARRLRKLGYRDRTALGNGETALIPPTAIPDADADAVVETWRTAAVIPGTIFALLSDGIADSLPTDAIDRITRRRSVQRAAPEIVSATRKHRLRERRREKASLSEMGLDNMSAVLARFEGPPRLPLRPSGTPVPRPGAPAAPAPRPGPAGASALPNGTLIWLHGLRGGPHPDSGGPFGLVCLAPPQAIPGVLPRFLRSYLDSEDALRGQERLARAYVSAAGPRINLPFSAVALEGGASPATFAVTGGALLPLPAPGGRAGGGASSRRAGRGAGGGAVAARGRAGPAPWRRLLNASPPAPPPSFSAPSPPYLPPPPALTPAPDRSDRPTPLRGVLLAGAALTALVALVLLTGVVQVSVDVRPAPWLQGPAQRSGPPAVAPDVAPPPEPTAVPPTPAPRPAHGTPCTPYAGGLAISPTLCPASGDPCRPGEPLRCPRRPCSPLRPPPPERHPPAPPVSPGRERPRRHLPHRRPRADNRTRLQS